MASRQDTVDFLLDQLNGAGMLSARRMFGEFAVYCDERVVAVVCDDQFFVKPTAPGRTFLGKRGTEQPPFPGAKPWLLVDGEAWDDHEWLAELVRITTANVPLPKPKPKRKRVPKG